MTLLPFLVALAAAIAGGAIQSALGFGAAVTVVPALAVLAPELLPVASLCAMLPLVAAMAWRGRGEADVHGALRLLAGRVPGVGVGAWLVAVLDTRQLTMFVATILLVAVVSMARGWTVTVTPRTQAVAGFTSGVTGTSTGLGGPPLALLYRGEAAALMRGTLAIAFLGGVCLSLGTLTATGQVEAAAVRTGLALGGGTLAGLLLAAPLVHRLSDERLRHGVLAWASIGALVAVVRAVTG